MAYRKVFGSNEDENKNVNNVESGVVGGGASSTSNDPNASRANPGSAWTNLQTYLDANQGTGGAIANAITQKTQSDIDAVGKDINTWQQDAKARVDENTRKDDYSAQIKQDPSKVDQGAFSAWKNLGNYWGANQAEADQGYGDVYKKAGNASDAIKNAGDYYGQTALAQKAFGQDGRNYTAGMGSLDTFVARADKSGQDAFANFQNKNAGFKDQIGNAAKDVNSYIQGAANRGQSAYDTAMNSIAERQKGIQDAAQGRFDAEKQAALDENRSIYNQMSKGNPQLGIQQRQAADTTLNDSFDISDVYSQADVDALNALAGLDNDENTKPIYQVGNDRASGADSYRKLLADYAAANPVNPKQDEIDAAARQGFATAGGVAGQGPIDITNTQPEIDYQASKGFEDAGGFRGTSIPTVGRTQFEEDRKSKGNKKK